MWTKLKHAARLTLTRMLREITGAGLDSRSLVARALRMMREIPVPVHEDLDFVNHVM